MCFNPRAPYGARLRKMGFYDNQHGVSIHAPRTGRDRQGRKIMSLRIEFQSTRPVRGATLFSTKISGPCTSFNPRAPYGARHYHLSITSPTYVSIHAPRTGRDRNSTGKRGKNGCFNPRAPYGARPTRSTVICCPKAFQSTRPVRGATNADRPNL